MTARRDADAAGIPRHTKASRDDWVGAALDLLTRNGVEHVKVQPMARQLGVSRSSFYWYFDDRESLLDDLLIIWTANTRSIVERTERDAPNIVAAVLGVFECWADERLFDPKLDGAVRAWARRSPKVLKQIESADSARVDAISAMFEAHGYTPDDALVRARLLYHSQVGYYAAGTAEPMDVRLGYLPYYLRALTGLEPTDADLAKFANFVSKDAIPA